jgi:hypothetical protein
VNSNRWPRRSNPCGKKETDTKRKVCVFMIVKEILFLVVILTVEAKRRNSKMFAATSFVANVEGIYERSSNYTSSQLKTSKLPFLLLFRFFQTCQQRTLSLNKQVFLQANRPNPPGPTSLPTTCQPDLQLPSSSKEQPSFNSTYNSHSRTVTLLCTAQPAQPVFTMTQPKFVVPDSESVSFPSLSSESPVSTVGDSPKEQSIVFNNTVKKELDVEMVRVLSHGAAIRCVQFSRDGKYLAAGCTTEEAYIYDVETGALSW